MGQKLQLRFTNVGSDETTALYIINTEHVVDLSYENDRLTVKTIKTNWTFTGQTAKVVLNRLLEAMGDTILLNLQGVVEYSIPEELVKGE